MIEPSQRALGAATSGIRSHCGIHASRHHDSAPGRPFYDNWQRADKKSIRFKLTGCVQTSVVANTCASQKNPRAKGLRACRVPEHVGAIIVCCQDSWPWSRWRLDWLCRLNRGSVWYLDRFAVCCLPCRHLKPRGTIKTCRHFLRYYIHCPPSGALPCGSFLAPSALGAWKTTALSEFENRHDDMQHAQSHHMVPQCACCPVSYACFSSSTFISIAMRQQAFYANDFNMHEQAEAALVGKESEMQTGSGLPVPQTVCGDSGILHHRCLPRCCRPQRGH